MTRRRRPHALPRWGAATVARCALAGAAAALAGCGSQRVITVATTTETLVPPDGAEITTHRLAPYPEGLQRDFSPWGMVGYMQDTEPVPVLNVTPRMAEVIALNMIATLVELRGVQPDGAVNETVFWIGSALDVRTQDHLAAIRRDMPRLRASRPLILIGEGEGGAVAAAIAAAEERVTHLILLRAGGGWTGEQELRHWLATRGEAAGLRTEVELDAALVRIRAEPDSLEMLGARAFRAWAGRLDTTLVDHLADVDIPILIVHGSADQRTPVESSRALRTRLRSIGRDVMYVEIDQADEHFRNVATGRSMYNEVEMAITNWLEQEEVISSRTARRMRKRLQEMEP